MKVQSQQITQAQPHLDSAVPTITQAELAEYVDLLRMERHRRELRLVLLEKLNAGAVVERGPLAAKRRDYFSTPCTWGMIEELIGPELMQSLKADAEKRKCVQLYVGGSKEKNGKSRL